MTPNPPGLRGFIKSGIRRLGAYAGFGGSSDAYDGAKTWGKGLVYINPNPNDSEKQLNLWTRRVISGLSSHLYRNVGFARGVVNTIASHSVGSGMFPNSSVPVEKIAESHDDYWRQWCKIGEISGRFHFDKVLEMASKGIDAEGDLGWVQVKTQNDFPKVQVVRSHRIESEVSGEDGWYDGVKRNEFGQHVAYSVRATSISGIDRFVKIPASSFLLLGDPDRPDEVRYASGLAHGILHMRDKKDILGFEKIGVKVASSLGLKIKRKGSLTDDFIGTGSKGSDGAGGTRDFEALQGGAVINFEPGEDAEIFSSNRPSPTFSGFLEYIDRDVATGCRVPLEFFWDPSKLGGTAQRFVLQLAQHRFEERQRLLAWHATRIRNWVIACGIIRGDIEFHPDWWRVEWQFCSKITVDVGREAQANREDYIVGLRTAREDYSERGKSLKEARKDSESSARDLLKRAERLVSEFASSGITIAQAIDLIEKRGNSGSPPANASQPTPAKAQEPTKASQ